MGFKASSWEDAIREARSRLPLKTVIEQHGDGPSSGGNWKSFACPFCGVADKKAKTAGVVERGGRHWFKCFHTSCPTSGKGLDEGAYIASKTGMGMGDALRAWFKQAGVEVEKTQRSPASGGRKSGGGSKSADSPKPAQDTPLEQARVDVGTEEAEAARVSQAVSDDGDVAPAQVSVEDASADASPPQPAGASEDDDGDDSPLAAMREFYAAASPIPENRLRELWEKRGLTEEMVAWSGLKLSCRDNLAILEKLRDKYELATLIRAGLYTVPNGGSFSDAKPNAQFYGFGFINKKRDAQGRKMDDWETGWIDPILIPYFDTNGDLVHLRPHKGMQRDERVRMFIARPCRAWREARGSAMAPGGAGSSTPKMAIITEGEFKALALVQALNGRLPSDNGDYCAGALPGITNAKNWFVWEPMKDWLEGVQPKSVVVAYDSEEKGDPKLPGYTPNRWNRHDALVWARYLVEKLAREAHDVRLGLLPVAWRDAKGKADWDGALAQLVKSSGKATWPEVSGICRKRFLDVLNTARPSRDFQQLTLLGNSEAFIVEKRLRQISYEPQLPYGDSDEQRLSHKLRKLVREHRRRHKAIAAGTTLSGRERCLLPLGAIGSLMAIAGAYTSVQGCYYILKEPVSKDKASPESSTRQNWLFRRATAKEFGDDETAWACDLALKGTPEPVSDFYMRPYFILRRSNGKQERHVKLVGVHGSKTNIIPLDSKSFAQPVNYREWCLNQKGGYAWKAGEKELERLHTDTNAATAGCVVNEVPYFGYHSDSGMWLFEDCAFAPDGTCIEPDKHGVIWWAAEGYKVGNRDLEDQEFSLGRPKMNPLQILEQNPGDGNFYTIPGSIANQNSAVVRDLFGEFESRLFETLGGYDAWMVIGGMALYAAMPEVFKEFSGCGGLWFHGETQQGKSSVARWATHMWGMDRDDGLNVRKMTNVGLAIAVNQYSNLPVWFEEFKRDVSDEKQEAIKCCYNREGGPKWAPGGQRRVRTAPVITGESTSMDAATRSRYPHILVSATKRVVLRDGTPVNWFPWFQRHRKVFYVLGRELLRKRSEFSAAVLKWTDEFRKSAEISVAEHRAALVFGNVFGAFMAMHNLFGGALYGQDRVEEFRKHCAAACVEAVREVRERVNVEVFLQEIVAAHQRGVFGHNREEIKRYFVVKRDLSTSAPGYPNQVGWPSYRLYIAPDAVFGMLRKELRSQGRSLQLEPSDTRAQLAQRPYFIQGSHVQRFGETTVRAWGIDLDLCPEIGYCPRPDAEVIAAQNAADQKNQVDYLRLMDEWGWTDPRRGGLYGIVESLMNRTD